MSTNPEILVSDTSSSSTSSLSSDSSSEDSDSDDDIDDTDLLIQIRKKLAATASICDKKPSEPEKTMEMQIKEDLEKFDEPKGEFKVEPSPSPEIIERTVEKRATSIDERLKEQFNLLKDEESAPKKRRGGLVEEIIISVSITVNINCKVNRFIKYCSQELRKTSNNSRRI